MSLTAHSSSIIPLLAGTPTSGESRGPEQLDPRWSPAARRGMLRNGYFPTPTKGKAPVLDNWRTIRATEADIVSWETTCPYASNTGLLTATTPTVDIDVLDPAVMGEIYAMVEKLIPEGCPKLFRVGRPPKRAVPFRLSGPSFSKIATPFYLSEDGKKHRVEILGDGQQVVVFGIHPDTGRRYRWSGGAPWQTPWSSLPILTESAARKLIADVIALFEARGWRPERPQRPKESPRPRPASRSDGEAHKIAVALAERIETLCAHLLPNGRRQAAEWCIGSINGESGDSLRIRLSGEKAGIWCDFAEESDRGDALDLIEAVRNCSTIDAMDWARAWLGWPAREPSHNKPNKSDGGAATRQAETSSRAQAHDWDDPDWSILDDRRGELPEFPLHILSPKLQALINRTAKGAGVTPAHVAVPLIGIVSSLIGIARRIETTSSWRQPMTCWTAVIGFSGTGKTPGLNVTKRCVKQVERNNKNSDDAKRRAYETRREGASAARAKWKKAVEDATEANKPTPPMPVEAMDSGKFIPPKLYISDGTIERLGELLQARPQGILFLRDELSGLFTNMSRYSSGQDNEFWLEAWNGDSFNVERMGRVTHVDHLLIGIAGGMQPDKLVKSFEGDHDGMYARVLFAWPSEPGCPVLSNEALEIEPDIQNAISRVDKLAELTAEGVLVIRNIPLSPEAWTEFAQFLQFAHQGKDAFEGREREWWAKISAHALRLSGTLTYLPWAIEGGPEPAAIGRGAMSSAITLARDYFWPHARACLRQIGLTERHTNARRVLRWLRAAWKTEVSREEVRREALSQRLDADETTELLASLCRSGWLREKTSPSRPQGGKPSRRWLVNPNLFNTSVAETAETPTGVG